MGEHLQRDAITSVDFTLSSRDEDIMDDIDRLRKLILKCLPILFLKSHLLHADRGLVCTLHVLQANLGFYVNDRNNKKKSADLVIKKRLQKRDSAASCPVRAPGTNTFYPFLFPSIAKSHLSEWPTGS